MSEAATIPANSEGVSAEPTDRVDARQWNFSEALRREATFEVKAGKEDRTCELSFSSELPVARGDYDEVLSHDESDMDLSRLNDSHPMLLNHDPEKQIGVCERAWCDGGEKKGRAVVRFSKSPLGQEIWQDVQDGIRRLVSVGYKRTREVSSEKRDGREVVRFAWQPYEVSIVSVPADATVGIGRNQTEQPKEKIIMEVNQAPVESYQKEAREILAVAKNLRGKVENVDDLAASAISEGKTVAEFRSIALDRLPSIKPLEKPLLSEVKQRDWGRYSLTRAIMGQADGKLDGFEREISDETAIQTGQKAQGFWLPGQVLSRNYVAGGVTVSSNTLGGVISTAQNLGSEFIEVLRNKAKVLAMGARVLNLNSAVTIPRQYTEGTANWVAETTAGTLAGFGLQNITLQPFAITAVQQYSKQLLATSNPSIDNLVRDDINNIIALAIDRAALHGSGSGQPLGIAGTTGINTVSVAMLAASALTTSLYPFLVSLENEIAVDNADIGAMGYLMRPTEKSACKVTARFASTNTPVWENGEVNGYRAEATNQIATALTTGTATTICTAIFFGVWSELLLAQFNGGATDLVVDPYSLSLNRVIRLVASRWVDVGVRHPAAFCVGGGLIA